MHGADRVILVGWDGYKAGYYNGNRVPGHRVITQDAITGSVMAEITTAWPHASIIYY